MNTSITKPKYTVIPAREARHVAAAALARGGATAEDAEVQAGHLVEAELRGHPSHGIRRLPVLLGRLNAGLITSGVAPTYTWTGPSALTVNGNHGFGPCIAYPTIDLLLDRAGETGVAVAAVRKGNHLGMLAPYVELIAHRNAIGIILTTSEALVHPWNGALPLIGTNPIGIGIPNGDQPLVLDMSTASVSMGKILDHEARNLPLLDGWAVDTAGRPTTNAADAANGAITPFGGPKGYALGLAFEAMVGLLTRTSYGQEVKGTLDTVSPTTKGDVVIVISLDAFGAPATGDGLAQYLNLVRSSAAESSSTVWVPGDRARQSRDEAASDGIRIDCKSWDRAKALADKGES